MAGRLASRERASDEGGVGPEGDMFKPQPGGLVAFRPDRTALPLKEVVGIRKELSPFGLRSLNPIALLMLSDTIATNSR